MENKSFEEIAFEVAEMEKGEIIHRITNFRGKFKMDFTEEFLNRLSLDRLRHILLAAFITNTNSQIAHN